MEAPDHESFKRRHQGGSRGHRLAEGQAAFGDLDIAAAFALRGLHAGFFRMCQGQLLHRQIEIAGGDGAGTGKFARALLFVFRVGEGHVGASLLGLQTNRGCLGHGRARGGGAHVGLVLLRLQVCEHLSQLDVVALVDQDVADSPRHVEPQLRFPPALDGAAPEDFTDHVAAIDVMQTRRQWRKTALVRNRAEQERRYRDLDQQARAKSPARW